MHVHFFLFYVCTPLGIHTPVVVWRKMSVYSGRAQSQSYHYFRFHKNSDSIFRFFSILFSLFLLLYFFTLFIIEKPRECSTFFFFDNTVCDFPLYLSPLATCWHHYKKDLFSDRCPPSVYKVSKYKKNDNFMRTRKCCEIGAYFIFILLGVDSSSAQVQLFVGVWFLIQIDKKL